MRNALSLWILLSWSSFAVAAPNGSAPVYNVKLPPYNAVGNGVADDSVAIQNAINDAGAGGAGSLGVHGIVYLPEGTYKVTSTLSITSSSITIRGAGGTSAQAVINFTPSTNVPLFNIDISGGGWNVVFSQLYLAQTNANGILINNSAATGAVTVSIEDCIFQGNAQNQNELVHSELSNTYIRRCFFNPTNQYQYAMRFRKVNSAINIDSEVTDSYVANTGKGVVVDKDSSSTTGQVEGLKIIRDTFLNTGGEQITVNAAFHMNIGENMLDQNGYICIWLYPTLGSITSIIIHHNYFGAHTTTGGEVFVWAEQSNSTVNDVFVSENQFINGRYGIIAGNGTPAQWVVTNNIMQGNNSAGSAGIWLQSGSFFNVIGNVISCYGNQGFISAASNVNNIGNLLLTSTSSCTQP
jgi:hypothetical protein